MRVLCRAFDDLSPRALHDILKARADAFVVEQACAFPEIDGEDPGALHLTIEDGAGLVAYARLFGPDDEGRARIGRVVTVPRARGRGLGRRVMEAAIAELRRRFGPVPVALAAQAHLEAFYTSLGFTRVSEDYLEDGIPHLDMRLSTPTP